MVLNKCDTNDQSADILTKSFTDEVKWKHACSLIHMGRSVKDPVAVPEEKKSKKKVVSAAAAIACCCFPLFASFREGAQQKKERHQHTSHSGKAVEEPFEEPFEEQSRPVTSYFGKMPAPNYKFTSTAPDAEDIQGWDRLTNGNHLRGPHAINIMASPQEWAEIAEWYSDVLRTRHPRHFKPEDFVMVREEMQRHRERDGRLADVQIARFDDISEQQLALQWPKAFSLERRQNRALDYRKDMQLFRRACFWVKHIYSFVLTTTYAPLFAVFDWDTACPWCTDVKFIDYAFRDLRKRQVFTHPDKLGNTTVVDYWPSEDLEDSAKFMTTEMYFLRTLRDKLLKEGPATATPAGGSAKESAARSTTR
eukprot:651732-Amphidinium_carterae.1